MTKILQEKAGVPQSRMERPFFTLFEDHLVLNEQDILAITKKNTREGFRWDRKWRKADGWEEHLKWLTMPREGEEETVVEDTLLMINAGAHVSASGFVSSTSNECFIFSGLVMNYICCVLLPTQKKRPW